MLRGTSTSRFRWLGQGLGVMLVCWMIVVFVLVRLLGDRWWIGTLALYSPRWLLVSPICVGILLGPWLSRRLRWAVIVSSVITCWAVLGFCVPWSVWGADPEVSYRILTCNVAGWKGGTERLEQLILDEEVDIVMLQEYSEQSTLSLPAGWSSCHEDRLFIASRYPLEDIRFIKSKGRWPTALGIFCEAQTSEGTLPLGTLHFSSPRRGLSNVIDSKTILAPSRRAMLIEQTAKRQDQSERVSEMALGAEGAMIVAGDFNMPVESYFFRQHWHEFQDSFSAVGCGFGHTMFVEVRGVHWGARIDHVITRGKWHSLRCWVGPDVGSDHRPVLADVYWE